MINAVIAKSEAMRQSMHLIFQEFYVNESIKIHGLPRPATRFALALLAMT